jgi:hypothetical protein
MTTRSYLNDEPELQQTKTNKDSSMTSNDELLYYMLLYYMLGHVRVQGLALFCTASIIVLVLLVLVTRSFLKLEYRLRVSRVQKPKKLATPVQSSDPLILE